MDVTVIEQIHEQLSTNISLFQALGDQERLDILANLAKAGSKGLNVTEITARSALSRPAISHHLKSLKDSHIILSSKIGTKIYYRIDTEEHYDQLRMLVSSIQAFINALPPEYHDV